MVFRLMVLGALLGVSVSVFGCSTHSPGAAAQSPSKPAAASEVAQKSLTPEAKAASESPDLLPAPARIEKSAQPTQPDPVEKPSIAALPERPTAQQPPAAAKTPEKPAVPSRAQAPKPVQDKPQAEPRKTPSRSFLVVGDSFAVGIGVTLDQTLAKTKDIAVIKQGKVSSGLNSPWFYNWDSMLRQFIDSKKPEAIVVMIGGNDAHNGSGSSVWAQEYQAKAENFLKITAEKGIKVFWAGLPPMGNPQYSSRAKVANGAMEAACSHFANCSYVDSWSLFGDASGNYTRVKAINGKPVELRGGDGVHFTLHGYRLLSDRIMESIAASVNVKSARE